MSHYKKLLHYSDVAVTVLRGSMDLFNPEVNAHYPGYPGTITTPGPAPRGPSYPGQQSAAAALIGATMAQIEPSRNWSKADVDQIIRDTEPLFLAAVNAPEQTQLAVHVRLDNLPWEFYAAGRRCRVCVKNFNQGYVESDEGGTSLRVALLGLERSHLVLEHNNRFVSIWADNQAQNVGYLFDPLGADYPRHTAEVACVFRFERFDALLPLLRKRLGMQPMEWYDLYEVELEDAVLLSKVVERLVASRSTFTPAVPPPKSPDILNRPPAVGIVPASPSLYVDNFAAPPALVQPVRPARVEERLLGNPHLLDHNAPHDFVPVDEHVWMLMGLLSEREISGVDFRDLAPPQCLVALATLDVRYVRSWKRDNVDQVLEAGWRLYDRTKEQNPGFQGQSARGYHHSRIEIDGFKMIPEVEALSVMGRINTLDDQVLDLQQGLWMFFIRDNEERCVLEYGGLTTIAIRKYPDQSFCYFDPRAYNVSGQLSELDKVRYPDNYRPAPGKAAIFHCFSLEGLAWQLRRNIDPFQIRQVYHLRKVVLKLDQPGVVAWHAFQPLREGASWYLSGRINSADERSFAEPNRDKQCLGIAIMAIVAAHLVAPSEWRADDVDRAVLEGDDYYTCCKPGRTGESGNDDWYLSLKNVRLIAFHQRRKCRLLLRERVCTGDLATTKINVFGQLIASGPRQTLPESLGYFFSVLNETHGIFECSLRPGERPNYLAFWAHRQELDSGVVEWSYYLFHEHPDAHVRRVALGADPTADWVDERGQRVPPPAFAGQESACVLRFGYMVHLVEFLQQLFLGHEDEEDEYAGLAAGPAPAQQQQQQQQAAVKQPPEFHLHSLKLDSIEDKALEEDELAREKYLSVIPELTEYVRDTPTSGYVLGSENRTLDKFQYRESHLLGAGVALSALAMRHLCDSFKWTTGTIDTIMAVGESIARSNRTEISADNDNDGAAGENQQEPRDYHLPDEFPENVNFGVHEFIVRVDKYVDGKAADLSDIVKEFFNDWSMGVIRGQYVQMAMWRYDNVYFFFERLGAEDNGFLAGCYYELDYDVVVDVLKPIARLSDSFSIYRVQLDLLAPLPRNAMPVMPVEDSKLDWYKWLFEDSQCWVIECGPIERFNVNSTVSMCVTVLMFASIYEPQQWTSDLLQRAVIMGQALHGLNVERMVADRKFGVHEMISEFCIGGRLIQPDVQDCAVHDYGAYGGTFEENFRKHLAHFFIEHRAGILCSRDEAGQPKYVALWKKDDKYYVFYPDDGTVRRWKDLRFSNCFGKTVYSRWEIAAFSVTNCEFVRNVPDPSPALRPVDLPELVAYKPIARSDGQQLPACGILQASFSEERYPEVPSDIFDRQGYPTSANCLVAIVFQLVHEPSMWTKGKLDEILKKGYELHVRTLQYSKWQERLNKGESISMLDPEDVHRYINIKESRFYFEVLKFHGRFTGDHPPLLNEPEKFLMDQISEILRQYGSCILIINNRYMVSIWLTEQAYYLFDPKPRDERGLQIKEAEAQGHACVTWYGCLTPLVQLIKKNSDKVWNLLEIYPVRAMKVLETDLVKQDVERLIKKNEPLIKSRGASFEKYYWPYEQLYKMVQKTSIKPPMVMANLPPTVEPSWPTVKLPIRYGDKKKIVGYIYPEYRHGSIHLETTRARTLLMAGQQSTAVAVVALCLAKLFEPGGWTSKMIDQVLQNGSFLHVERIHSLRGKLKLDWKPYKPAPVENENDETFLHNRNIGRLPRYASLRALDYRLAEAVSIPARPDELVPPHPMNRKPERAEVFHCLNQKLYDKLGNLGYNLHVLDIPGELRLGGTTYLVQVARAATCAGTCAGGWIQLLSCLETHFEKPAAPDLCLLYFGDFTLAIVRSAKGYFFLDPTEKNKALMPWAESQTTGAACLFKCKDLRDLAVAISDLWEVWPDWDKIANVSRRDYTFDSYELYTVSIEPHLFHGD